MLEPAIWIFFCLFFFSSVLYYPPLTFFNWIVLLGFTFFFTSGRDVVEVEQIKDDVQVRRATRAAGSGQAITVIAQSCRRGRATVALGDAWQRSFLEEAATQLRFRDGDNPLRRCLPAIAPYLLPALVNR